jgi:acetylornithine deacetylase/succinyl-diaminopimelate desuccinylase-like protein
MRRFPALLLLAASCAGPAARPGEADLDRDAAEAVELLRALVRVDTTNPPPPGSARPNAGETEVCRLVRDALARDGIQAEILESAPGRGNLVARIRGSGKKKPLLLMAHVDVVGADRAKWTADPFGAELRDGFIWGRGALDDKDDAAVFAQALRVLARAREPLSRDVILMLNADEESSGAWGAAWMVERHWDRIACEVALSEGGRTVLRDGRVVQAGFTVAEKVYNDFRIWIRGRTGHSSVPRDGNAILAASRLLARFETFRTPVRVLPAVAAQFAVLAETPAYEAFRDGMRRAAAGDLEAAAALCRDARLNAQLRSTVVPTLVRGGIRENVLPPDVEVNFNARLLPGERILDVVRDLMKHLAVERYEVVEGGEDAVEAWKRRAPDVDHAVFLVDRGVDAPATPHDTEAYRALEAATRRLHSGVLVSPQLATGATDLRFLRTKGVLAYGVSPCPTGEDEEGTVHGHDERVRVASVREGLRWTLEVVRELAR